MKYLAHKSEDGREQSLIEHLEGTSKLAALFADCFGQSITAKYVGLFHDIGKYSVGFQNRIQNNGPKVDHSSAGAQIIKNPLAAFCIAGHHNGLMNLGSVYAEGTLKNRLNKELNGILDFSAWKNDLDITIPNLNCELSKFGCQDSFGGMLLTRMLFSCLVDADFLDTEAFMSNQKVIRGNFDGLNVIYERYIAYIKGFGNPTTPINIKRSEILNECLSAAEKPEGLYSLTVPTGGGKTLSSLGFAIKHAIKYNKKRIIYVIPFTSIIEQTADIFREVVGKNNVVEHHMNVDYDKDESLTEKEIENFKLATENWDAPIIVTTNVQFFDSLFSNKVSKCRKLHNIADSVLVFDEAQMIPNEFLLPCIRVIDELVKRYRVTAVLCTATQPSFESVLQIEEVKKCFPEHFDIKEICSDTQELYNFFKRVTYSQETYENINELVSNINGFKQVLCIVNSKKTAQTIFASLNGEKCYHLSTSMFPQHRRQILAEIRDCLKLGLKCKVIATSLVEAGVDLDFPVVFRETAGLDNIIQAAGRCNREGKYGLETSIVHVFEIQNEVKVPPYMRLPKEVTDIIKRDHQDISSVEAIKSYFKQLHEYKGQGLDAKCIIKQCNDTSSFPFRDIAKQFKLINDDSICVLIPYDEEAEAIVQELRNGIRTRALLRKAGQFVVNVYEQQYEKLFGQGAIEKIDDNISLLTDVKLYNDKTGLNVNIESGIGIFL